MEGLTPVNGADHAAGGHPPAARAPHVELRGISKRFDATLALDRVSLRIEAGTIHALVGENGAGKSTLGKVLAGVHVPDEGALLLDGEPVSFRSPAQALRHGVTIIAQELSLVPTRDVTENVYLGMEDHTGPLVNRRRMRQRFAELVAETGLDVPAGALVRSLSVAQQQQVEILRAVARQARLIVMDEPTARLSAREAESLHAITRSLAARGTTVIYVSHYLEEVLALADTVSVLRDGRLVQTGPAADETPDSLVVAMAGRALAAGVSRRRAARTDGEEVLRVEGLTRAGAFEDVSLTIRAGEIVGLFGLVGAGRSEVARGVFGADRCDRGRVLVAGRERKLGDPRRMMAAGIAMIPESRKTAGLLLGRSVRENMSLRHLERFSRLGVVRREAEVAATRALADELGVKRASNEQAVGTLSGGNQQKVLFGRWLMERPLVLIADEPTSGVDVSAKRAIYELIARLADEGVGVLLISSESEEILGLADRALVMRNGAVVAELAVGDASEHRLIEAAFGAQDSERQAA